MRPLSQAYAKGENIDWRYVTHASIVQSFCTILALHIASPV